MHHPQLIESDLSELTARQRRAWAAGNYPKVASRTNIVSSGRTTTPTSVPGGTEVGPAIHGAAHVASLQHVTERGQDTEPHQSEYDRLGVTPTPDDGTRLSSTPPWDETERPHRERSGPDVDYTRRGRLVGQHLIDVHDMLRTRAGRAALGAGPGARGRARRRRRPRRAERDGAAAERLDAGRILRPLLRRRDAAPRARGRRHLPPPRAQRAGAHRR